MNHKSTFEVRYIHYHKMPRKIDISQVPSGKKIQREEKVLLKEVSMTSFEFSISLIVLFNSMFYVAYTNASIGTHQERDLSELKPVSNYEKTELGNFKYVHVIYLKKGHLVDQYLIAS